ncbi:IS66 family insertion sequence element accessory protein TnpA [Providencia huaxiensis]|uniref:IS66 family insertion sequence element accessory protein TnpA n=1 Tax=Providencia huaxiensis TaxID=2027290 RepID=UPI0037581886
MANVYTSEFKKQHVDAWRVSGLTRREYAHSQGINPNTFKHWPSQLSEPISEGAPNVIPVSIIRAPLSNTLKTDDNVMVYLPNGCRVACQPSQLAVVFQALAYAEA